MTALAKDRARTMARWTYQVFTLASGHKAWKDGAAAIDLSTGKVVPAANDSTNQLVIGEFHESVDATAADDIVNVNLGTEIEVVLWENDGTIDGTDIGHIAYFADDQTVTSLEGGPIAGRVWGIDPYGVWIQKLPVVGGGGGAATSGEGGAFVEGTFPAYVSNTATIPDHTPNGQAFEVGTTAAASTVVLGAATEGDLLYFAADGTKNGHTVQFFDGATAITTALTASKRHLVICLYLNGKWRANAYVSP